MLSHISIIRGLLLPAVVCTLASACSTYYQDNVELERRLQNGDLEGARDYLEAGDDAQSGKNRVLYLMNQGVLYSMLGEPDSSNRLLNEADYIIEDYTTSVGQDILSYLINPGVLPYRPEDFEAVMVHYYKALNYMQSGRYDEALVECRRINIKLQALNDLYEHENRYKQDAFAHNLMGLVYDAAGDYNNAFIAYRNALEAYQSDYSEYFGLGPPEQLKLDLLRAAYRMGFMDKVQFYERQFGIRYEHKEPAGGELVFFWNMGLGPVKGEWSINFIKVDDGAGWITFKSDYEGFSFPFYVGDRSEKDQNALEKITVLRIAFPKYNPRTPLLSSATLTVDGRQIDLEKAQDINAIALKSLEDRMLREFGQALLRVALKKALEYGAGKESKTVGAIIGIASALTEQADTRNWQTLPSAISYARVALPAGENTLTFYGHGPFGHDLSEDFTFTIRKGRTVFHSFSTLGSTYGGR